MNTIKKAYKEPTMILPDDILAAILALAKVKFGKDRFAFRGHDSELQRIFLQLAGKTKAPLLEVFVFSDSGPVPYSPALNEAVSKLQLSGFVGRDNPDYEWLFLRPAAVKYFESILDSRFSKDDKKQLDQIADEFLKLIHTNG